MTREELKKIWKPKWVLILIFLGFIFYTMFLEFYIEYFPNGPQAMGIFQVSKRMVEQYGTSLSRTEIEELKAELPRLYQEADQDIREFDLTRKHGLNSYEDYLSFCDASLQALERGEAADKNTDYADSMRIQQYLTSQETENISGRIYGAETLLQMYEAEEKRADSYRTVLIKEEERTEYSQKEYEHIRKTFYNQTEDWKNVLPIEVVETTASYFSYLLVWICLSICLLLSPLLVYDQISRMGAIQFSSKRGRKLLLIQFKAVMLSAFVLTTVNLLIFGGIFMKNGTNVFSSCKMYSFENTIFCWLNWTYRAWCLALIGLSYLVAMGTAGIVFFLSGFSSNYIGMLLKLVPFFVITAILYPKLLYYAFYFNNFLYRILKIPYIEVIAAVVILLIGVGLGIYKFLLHQNYERC